MLPSFYAAQLHFVAALQKFAGLAPLFKAVTILGNEEFFLLLIPLTYICLNRRLGVQLGILVLASDALNVLLKIACAQPRPFWFDSQLALATDPSFGLPSSHAQNAVVVWFFLAGCWKVKHSRSPAYLGAAILVFLISLSRLFLGVHFPTDILAGWLIGAAFLAAYIKIEPALAERFRKAASGALAISFLGPLLMFMVAALMCSAIGYLGNDLSKIAANAGIEAMASRAGALCGLGLGLIMAHRYARFTVDGSPAHRFLNFIIVFIGVLFFWRGLGAVFPKNTETLGLALRFLRYALLTGWVAYLAPLLLIRLKRLRPLETTLPA